MRYGLPQISQGEFDNFHKFVQACFDEGRQRFSPELVTIGTDINWFPQLHQAYLAKDTSLGVTMEDYGEYQSKFHIWINPAYKEPSFRFYATLAHELVHGYAGMKYSHNAHWRRWFYRVLYHLMGSELIPQPLDSIRMVCYGLGINYNHRSASSELQLIDEAFVQAQKEHPKVLENYWRRLSCPK